MTIDDSLLGIREYARYRSERGARGDEGFDSCSPAAVRKAISTGRIAAAVVGEGSERRIRRNVADSLWASNTMPSQQRPRASAKESTPESQLSDVDDDAPRKSVTSSQSASRARDPMTMQEANLLLIKYRARRERIEYLREVGKLVDATTARNESFELARRIRDRGMELPSRLCDELAAETDPRRIRSILDRELREVFVTAAAAARAPAEVDPPAPAPAPPPPAASRIAASSEGSKPEVSRGKRPPKQRRARPAAPPLPVKKSKQEPPSGTPTAHA